MKNRLKKWSVAVLVLINIIGLDARNVGIITQEGFYMKTGVVGVVLKEAGHQY